MSLIGRIPRREGSPTDVLAQLADLTDGLPFHEMDDDAAVVERAIRLAHQLAGAVDALAEIANGSPWTAIQTRAHAVAALEAMGVDPYAERKVERPA
jgi:hypothetical protein